jgi:hypothetical protein
MAEFKGGVVVFWYRMCEFLAEKGAWGIEMPNDF